MIWIIGQYSDRIQNADELLDNFLETFKEETTEVRIIHNHNFFFFFFIFFFFSLLIFFINQSNYLCIIKYKKIIIINKVQLSLLTAIVKLFIKRPTVGQALVPKVLKWATEDVDNPDLRDRAYIYWRLLSSDPVAAKVIVKKNLIIMFFIFNIVSYLNDFLLILIEK